MKIDPTPGRIVWVTPDLACDLDDGQPRAAIIAAVNADGTVNVLALDSKGQGHPRQNVPLVQEGETPPKGGYARWMPYQLGQAQKATEPSPVSPVKK